MCVCLCASVCNAIHRQNIYAAIAFHNWIHLKSHIVPINVIFMRIGVWDWIRYIKNSSIRNSGRRWHTKPDSNWIISLLQWLLFHCICKQMLGPTHMRKWMESASVHMMACDLFGCKPISKSMLCYFQLDPQKQTSVKFQRKCIWKYCLWYGGHFVQGEMSYWASYALIKWWCGYMNRACT